MAVEVQSNGHMTSFHEDGRCSSNHVGVSEFHLLTNAIIQAVFINRKAGFKRVQIVFRNGHFIVMVVGRG